MISQKVSLTPPKLFSGADVDGVRNAIYLAEWTRSITTYASSMGALTILNGVYADYCKEKPIPTTFTPSDDYITATFEETTYALDSDGKPTKNVITKKAFIYTPKEQAMEQVVSFSH